MTNPQSRLTTFDTPFNVIATLQQGHDASSAVDILTRGGVPPAAINVHRPEDGPSEDEVAELEAEMQDEAGASWGLLSGAQAKDAFRAALMLGIAGVLLGLVAGAAWAYLLTSGLSSHLGSIVIVACVTGFAAAIIGAVDGGGGLSLRRRQERDGGEEPVPAERDTLVTVHAQEPVVAERAAALLRELGAEEVHLIGAHGIPLPPQMGHPRPADPDGWWWGRAGNG
jgi:hypothetical protein